LAAVFRNNKRGSIMTIRFGRLGAWAQTLVLGTVLGLIGSSVAWAQSDAERQAIIKKVEHSVAKVIVEGENEGGHGSGYVVDDTGIVITNAHVVKPAKQMKKKFKRVYVTFPADGDHKEYETEGWLDVMPKRDLCLLRIKPEGKKLVPLKLCDKIPTPGDTVFTFGSPLGFDNTPAFGHITAYRTGTEIANNPLMGGKEVFEEQQGYSLESTWVQHDAAMSPGNSGGPLLNMKGEVLGLNTWHIPMGENMNFATSAENIKTLLKDASKLVKAWPDLPDWKGAGEDEEHGPSGNANKTLAVWKEMNRALNALNKKIDACEKKIKAIPPPLANNPTRGMALRMKKKSQASESMAEAYKEYAGKIRAIDTRTADPRVLEITVNESELAQHTGDTCHEIAMKLNTLNDLGLAEELELRMLELKEVTQEIRTKREVLRVIFCHQYNKQFPTLEETAKEDAQDPGAGESQNKKPDRRRIHPPDEQDEPAADGGDGYRTWTSRNGKFSVKAKMLRVANGSVTLVTRKGKKITVDIEKLSDDDQEFIRDKEAAPSSGGKEKEEDS
jgi:S1-C subfamily serine protease